MGKIYVASSWRNKQQPTVVRALRDAGHEVYDFKNPDGNGGGFYWSDIDSDWETWSPKEFAEHIHDPLANVGFAKDMKALDEADVCVLVMPCGRSAHLELGYARGRNKTTAILLSDGEPKLMYRLVDFLAVNIAEVLDFLR